MDALPTGTVTFVFTDIEGSTRLLQTLGDRWPDILEEHNRLLRLAISEAGGIALRTVGDAFFAVFHTASAAVTAAAAAQRALAAYPWPREVEMRVRIGMHTGEGTVGGDDYVGLDVHRAARIGAAAHGGQTLISAATAELARTMMPAELSLHDLGEHRLKDLARPERIFQLNIEGLQGEFPPIRSLETPTNLPTQRTSFVGREREVALATRGLDSDWPGRYGASGTFAAISPRVAAGRKRCCRSGVLQIEMPSAPRRSRPSEDWPTGRKTFPLYAKLTRRRWPLPESSAIDRPKLRVSTTCHTYTHMRAISIAR